MSGQENSLVRFVAPDGTVLADINASGERYPVPPSAGVAPDRSAILSWTSSKGDPGRVVAGTASFADGGVTVVIARVYVERSQAFAQYRRQIAVAVLSSALLAALCAAWMLHRGLRPLRVVAAHAAAVTPGTLAQRLDAGEAPSELQLANLLSNALRYADPDGTVTLQVTQGDGVIKPAASAGLRPLLPTMPGSGR